MEISQIIINRMREKRISGRCLATRLGVHPQTITWWRTGQRRPSVQYVIPLSDALDIDPAELLKNNN